MLEPTGLRTIKRSNPDWLVSCRKRKCWRTETNLA